MTDKFELLCMGISQVQKKIQKIKKMHMNSFGLKGTHVMCIYFLNHAKEGLTAAELCEKCGEDKAGISRTLAELENQKLITYDREEAVNRSKSSAGIETIAVEKAESGKEPGKPAGRRYRAHAYLTENGQKKADMVNHWVEEAVDLGSMGISREEEDIFYRVLFRISDNLDKAINDSAINDSAINDTAINDTERQYQQV